MDRAYRIPSSCCGAISNSLPVCLLIPMFPQFATSLPLRYLCPHLIAHPPSGGPASNDEIRLKIGAGDLTRLGQHVYQH